MSCRGCKPKRPNMLTKDRLNRRIKIQVKADPVTDAEGITTQGWNDFLSLWAFRKPLTTRWREYFQAAGINAEKMWQYEIRYRPLEDIKEEMRLLERGKSHDIKAVLEDVHGDRTETYIMALEVGDG